MYTRIVLRALKVSYSYIGEGGVAMNCEKNTIFPEHPVIKTGILIYSLFPYPESYSPFFGDTNFIL